MIFCGWLVRVGGDRAEVGFNYGGLGRGSCSAFFINIKSFC